MTLKKMQILKAVLLRLIRNKFLIFVLLFIILVYAIPLPKKLRFSNSKIVRFNDNSVMRVYVSSDEKYRIYLPLEEIDKRLIKSTICYEDRFFYYHFGINPVSLLRALYLNLKERKIVSGGSTITMQLARILEPKKRNIISKLIEMFRAIQFEIRLGKKRILELYLNLAPYGGNVEGVAAASLGYFGKLPYELTPAEIAFLVSLPQSPTLRRPGGLVPPEDGRNRVLKKMLKFKIINEKEFKIAIESSTPSGFKPFPFYAPHATDYLILKYPDKDDIKSSIDKEIQLKIENIANAYRRKIRNYGAKDISIVVIENKSGKVRGLIGTFDYFDTLTGKVIGFNSLRSPGSLLKPFLYIKCIEEGLITKEMLIEDVPYKFREYSPLNFNKTFSGLVKAEDALSQSLNVPFVIMLKKYGYNNFIRLLKETGIKPDRYIGLPIIIGGMEVSLLYITNLYASLSRGGIFFDYSVLEDDTIKNVKRLFNPSAVLLCLDALKKRKRPDAPNISKFAIPKGDIYWKTGTSMKRKDAWSVGFKKEYTVGVWIGNFTGEGNDSIIGAILSAPIMFDIIGAIDNDEGLEWIDFAESGIDSVEVCAFSGYRPNDNCPERKMVAVLRNSYPVETCPYHKKFLVEKKTNFRICPDKDYKKGEIVEKVFIILPPLVQGLLGYGKEPQFPKDCNRRDERNYLVILQPVNGATYIIPKGVKNTEFIPLQGYTSSKEGNIHWFINGEYIGKSLSGEIINIYSDDGTLEIFAQDDNGNRNKVKISVRLEE